MGVAAGRRGAGWVVCAAVAVGVVGRGGIGGGVGVATDVDGAVAVGGAAVVLPPALGRLAVVSAQRNAVWLDWVGADRARRLGVGARLETTFRRARLVAFVQNPAAADRRFGAGGRHWPALCAAGGTTYRPARAAPHVG